MLRVKILDGEVCLTVSDLYLPGVFPVSLLRSYTSYSKYEGPLGQGWDFPYAIQLERVGCELVLSKSGVELQRFPIPAEANGFAERNGFVLRSAERSGWSIWSRTDRLTYHFPGGREKMFAVVAEDLHGNALKLERDSDGRLKSLTDPLSRRLDFIYRLNRLHRIVLGRRGSSTPDHVVLECGYDAQDYLVWTSNDSRARSEYSYDEGRLVTYTNPLGGTYCASYDAGGRCVQVWQKHGKYSRQFAYDSKRSTTQVVDALGYSTLYRFDAQGQLTEKIDPLGGGTKYVRDDKGALIVELNALGEPVVFYRGELEKHRVTKTDPTGSSTTLELDANGEVVAVIDVQAGRWEYERDERGRIVGLRTPIGKRWGFQYDRMGRFGKIRNPDGWEVEHQWNEDGSREKISDGLGILAEKQFDIFGRIVGYRGPGGASLSVTYDQSIHEIRNVDGSVRRYEFDLLGNPRRFVDEVGSEWRFQYDPYGRLVRMTDPIGATRGWEYDGEGRVSSITNENDERVDNVRDPMGRVVKQRGFDGCQRTYEYDEAGRLVSKVDGNGACMVLENDGSGRPLVRRYADGSVVRTAYGVGNRLIRAEDDRGVLELQYDSMYRLSTETRGNTAVHYTYGWDRRPTTIRCAEREIHFKYDPRGNLREATEGSEFRLTLDRDPDSRSETATFQTGLCVRRQYDSRGRLIAQEAFSRGGALLLSTTYRYDQRSNLVETQRSGRESRTFFHNARGELTQVRRAGQVIRDYEYDRAGNRVRSGDERWGYDAGNRARRIRGQEYECDGEGRPTLLRGAAGERSFEYDAGGRLLVVRSPGSPQVEFEYDYWFRRTKKKVGDREERTVWASDSVLQQQLMSGSRLEYVFHPTQRTPLAVRIDGQWHAIICDQRDEMTDVVRLLDDVVIWSSDALGFESEVRLGDVDFWVPFRGPGQMRDPETGLSYQRARYYDCESGRFLTPDPLGVYGGLNFYRSCLNQPFLLVDPFGLQPCPLSQAECDVLFNDIEQRAESVEQRWDEMHTPAHDLPWEGSPPYRQLYPAAAVGAMGTPIAAGTLSLGSIDSHLRAYDNEQRGMQNRIQEYYEGQCSRFEDSARGQAMQENNALATRPPSLPHLGL